ncbi:hypothetical protein [Amycolatopsis sp. NPDC004079]|uniref:hypothetical protein n=1 Tax=Amycolatopsis sp. NPDC004079 TaxID=3154549 RepID=UPI0033A742F6
MGSRRGRRRRHGRRRREIRLPTPSAPVSPRTATPASELDSNWRFGLDEGQTLDQAEHLVPWFFSECVEDGEPIVLLSSPARFAQDTALAPEDREFFERWPFYMLEPGRDRTNTAVTCLRQLHHRLHATNPSCTMDHAIATLLEMETDGLLEWRPKEYSYIRTATPPTTESVRD